MGIILLVIILCLFPYISYADDSVCAKVKLEISQELTLERQAFDAHMRINNGLSHITLQNIDVGVSFADADGNAVLASSDPDNTEALFFIRLDSMENIDDVDGSGTVLPSSSADIHWLIIPASGASNGLENGTLYYVGATLSYVIGGEELVTDVSPDFIFVKPMPELTLDYFLPTDVYGDDAFTTEIEPSVPFSLGVRVSNSGAGTAQSLKIDSAQPRIIDNEQGLLVNFVIEGSEVNGAPTTSSLLANFGDILPNAKGIARWIMTCSLSGQFVEFNADYSHSNDFGGELTSLIDTVETHFLVRDVIVDLYGRDDIRDFLVKDGDVYRVYESDSVDTVVQNQSGDSNLQFVEINGTEEIYALSTPVSEGFIFVQVPDPTSGQKSLKQVARSDGKAIGWENAWCFKIRGENNSWLYYVGFFDVATTGAYTVIFEDPAVSPRPPVLQFIEDRSGIEGEQMSFIVEASDPNGTIPELSAAPLPAGASFIDQGDGSGIFDWGTAVGQAGRYEVVFQASDGALKDAQPVFLSLFRDGDFDNDRMDDQWELDHFNTLDRDGNGDYDGDGISDLDEFFAGTDPNGSAVIALVPGFNLVSIPDVSHQASLETWLPHFGTGLEIEKIMAYDRLQEKFITLFPGASDNTDIDLSHGDGFIVYAYLDKQIAFESVRSEPQDLTPGMNVVGFACPPEGYSAFDLLNALGADNVVSIQRYNTDRGAFETAAFGEDGSMFGMDFPIITAEGYFVSMKQAVIDFVLP